MKRILASAVVLSLLLALCACAPSEDTVSQTGSAVSETSDGDTINYEELLSAAYAENETLRQQIAALEEQLAEQTPPVPEGTVLAQYALANGATLYHMKNETDRETLCLQREDGEITEVHEDYYISYVLPSPDGTRILWSDFEREVHATVGLYDIESAEKTVLDLSELPENNTASFLGWLDDRYFLFVSQFDQGTVVMGGDVYVYDTQTGEYNALVKCGNDKLQITSFEEHYGGMMVFTTVLYDDEYNEYTVGVQGMLLSELYELIESNESVTVS